MLKKLLLAGAFCLSFVLIVQARTYYLPDYQATVHFGNRTNQGGTSASTPKPTPTCGTYGLYTAASRPSNADCTMVAIPGLVCYSCTTCSNSYIYNSSNCTGEYVPSGNSCGGKYDKCICDPAKYIATADGSGCEDGETADTSTSCVDKTTGKTLYTCIADPCYGLADNTSELGCDKYYDQCPSKCQLGTTCKRTDCSAYTLTSCPSGSTCKTCTPGCGDNAPRYKAKEYKGLAFQVDSPAGGKIRFNISGINYQIDWGDGNVNIYNSHTYKTAGLYDIKISGEVTVFRIDYPLTAKPQKLYSLDLPKIKLLDFSYGCSTLTGTIPPLPDSLVESGSAFKGCSKLTGSIPNLPRSLTNGYAMFSGCTGLTGSIPDLPDSLTDGRNMFDGCSNLTGTIPDLPDSLTYGRSMFYGCSNLTGSIPELPTKLNDGQDMFEKCSGLTGPIPELPPTLTNGWSMFSECSKLTGDIPALPDSLTNGSDMFSGCTGLNGKITSFGKGLTNGEDMFSGCSGLSGSIPELPSSLITGRRMFSGCSRLTGSIPKLPSSLTDGERMFDKCSRLTGQIPSLPRKIEYANSMFKGCKRLTGSIPKLPTKLTDGYSMFSGCSGLTGQTPIKPSGLTSYRDIFAGTQVTNDGSWPDSAW